MIRRPPRSTLDRSSAASDVYKRQKDDKKTTELGTINITGEGDRLGTGNIIQEEGTKAVSYTHLRAHETVLDLVCRLLLEKKQRNYTKPVI